MSLRVDLTFDCARAVVLAEFWKLALGYVDEPPPEQVWARVEAKVAQLVGAGASVLTVAGTHHVVLADPEGNEFCVAG